jgi:hypothetical protein
MGNIEVLLQVFASENYMPPDAPFVNYAVDRFRCASLDSIPLCRATITE